MCAPHEKLNKAMHWRALYSVWVTPLFPCGSQLDQKMVSSNIAPVVQNGGDDQIDELDWGNEPPPDGPPGLARGVGYYVARNNEPIENDVNNVNNELIGNNVNNEWELAQ